MTQSCSTHVVVYKRLSHRSRAYCRKTNWVHLWSTLFLTLCTAYKGIEDIVKKIWARFKKCNGYGHCSRKSRWRWKDMRTSSASIYKLLFVIALELMKKEKKQSSTRKRSKQSASESLHSNPATQDSTLTNMKDCLQLLKDLRTLVCEMLCECCQDLFSIILRVCTEFLL